MKTSVALALLTFVLALSAGADGPVVASHVITLVLDEHGVIRPYSHYFRERALDPKSETDLQEILEQERTAAPIDIGHIAIRATNEAGEVCYRTIASVAMLQHPVGTNGGAPSRVERPAFTAIVPACATSISLEGWEPASRVTFELDALVAAYGERQKECE
jgi:hypothetical protein